ncbi:MAG: ABC transporter permease [Phycisphaerae bacterium]|nr:ABC transporter permease [Phycisphaerae bacterium]MDD5380633.1 ABC transporter permease [Phycisphaerae bacterium]
MKKVFFLAIKDLKVLISNKSNIFWVFAFPTLFALFFGAVYSGAGKEPSGMKIAVVNEDNSEFSNSYISKLQSYEALEISLSGRDQAVEQVRKGKVAAAVVVKKGFGDGLEALLDSDEPKIEIASDPSRKMESSYLQGLLAKAQFEALGEKSTDRNWMRSQIGLWRDDVKDVNDAKQATLYSNFFDSFDTLLKDVNEKDYKSGFGGEMLNFAKLDVNREHEGPTASFQITFPQCLLWGILMCTSTFAISIVKERTNGTFERLRVGPIGLAHILAGKGLACFITCALMTCALYALARAIFKMPIGSLPLFILAVTCTLLCFVGLMMFICTLGRTEQSVGAAGWSILMIMGMLGGAMLPLIFMPSWLRPFSHISPVKWSIFAIEGAIWRNFALVEMVTPCLILLSIGTAAFLLGVVSLRRQDK